IRVVNPNSCAISAGFRFSGGPGFTVTSPIINGPLQPGVPYDVTVRFGYPIPLHSEMDCELHFDNAPLGGGYKFKLIGDVLPPAPPSPILSCPLGNTFTRQLNQTTFTWAASQYANSYVFLLSRDSSFQTLFHHSPVLSSSTLSYIPTVV